MDNNKLLVLLKSDLEGDNLLALNYLWNKYKWYWTVSNQIYMICGTEIGQGGYELLWRRYLGDMGGLLSYWHKKLLE